MRSVWAVIRREYLERVRSKWFILATIGVPVLILAVALLPAYMAERTEEAERRLAVVDHTGVLYRTLSGFLEEAGYEVEEAHAPDREVLARLKQEVVEKDLGGYLVVDEETLKGGRARYVGRSGLSPVRRVSIRGAVYQAALGHLLEDSDVDVERLLSGGRLEVEVLSSEGADFEDPEFMFIYAGSFLLYMVILLYAVSVMRSTLEEKSSRIVEVVVSSVRPFHLMLGKILGVGAVGLTQLAVWAAIGVFAVVMGLPALVAARPDLAELSTLGEFIPGLSYLGYFLLFFLGGYFIFSALYAAVGAMVNTEQEAQQAQIPLVFLLVAPILFIPAVIADPGSPLAVSTSLVPFFAPILMFARAVGGAAPLWQVSLSVVLMVLTVVAVAWVAGRIYKVGILMAGKRPTLPEVWRWVREA